MRVGIIGAGNLGTAIGRRLAERGHDITISFARTPEKVRAAADSIGHSASNGTPREAVLHAEVVVLATPWAVTIEIVTDLAEALAGKIVWDTTNPYAPTMDELLIGTSTSAGEEVAAAAPDAVVVKAIAPFAEALAGAAPVDGPRPTVFVCGDDDAARRTVASLVEDIDADPVDAGPLRLARFTEPAGMLVTNLAYVRGLGANIALVLHR